MKIYKNKYFVVVALWIVLLLPSAYYGFQQTRENEILDNYISENKLVNLPVNKQTAVLVSEQIRKDFNVNENEFVALNLNKRPFLREDTAFLLTYREGVCGFEGTRVIVNLLNRLGFDATRITLYNQQLFNRYKVYSYEAIPYTKILTKIGFDVRVFNFKRPPRVVSRLAEKPNMIMALISFVLAILAMLVVHRFKVVTYSRPTD